MPALSPTMDVGTILEWNKKVGERIEPGDVLGEIETDKAKIAFESTDEGYLAKILVEAGTPGVPVGKAVLVVVENKEDIPKFADFEPTTVVGKSAEAPSAPSTPSPAAVRHEQPDVILSLPALSPTMDSGKIISWEKQVGDSITAGDVLAEIETDKTTISFESTDEGYIAKILVPSGGSAKVGAPIALVVSNKADIAKFSNYTAEMVGSEAAVPSVEATPIDIPTASPSVTTKQASVPKVSSDSSRIVSSPRARLVAKEKGVDLSQVNGTGPNGRIIAADVEEFVPVKQQQVVETPKPEQPAKTSAALPLVSPVGAYTDVPASNIRKITADRLLFSKQNIPHYYLTMECNVDNLQNLRKQLNDLSKGEYKLSVNDFVVKAAAVALKAVPELNAEWRETSIRRYHNVNINVAVNTERGLLTPIVRDCDKIGLAEISNTIKAVAGRAQGGTSSLEDLQLGTFTISNLGMFGIKHFCAVINPPQAAILAVGGIEEKAVLVTSTDPESPPKFKNISTLSVTLSCDHRVVDGAVGAKWLQVFKDVIENPLKFLL